MISPATARFLRYVATGGTAAVVDLSIFTALHAGVGMGVPLAMTCSFCVAAVVNYTLTAVFVFGHRPNVRQLGFFVLGALAGWTINFCVTLGANAAIPFARIFSLAAVAVDLPETLFTPYAATAARACGILVAFLFNFYLNTRVVFRRSRPAQTVA